jgi:hypothetical protein
MFSRYVHIIFVWNLRLSYFMSFVAHYSGQILYAACRRNRALIFLALCWYVWHTIFAPHFHNLPDIFKKGPIWRTSESAPHLAGKSIDTSKWKVSFDISWDLRFLRVALRGTSVIMTLSRMTSSRSSGDEGIPDTRKLRCQSTPHHHTTSATFRLAISYDTLICCIFLLHSNISSRASRLWKMSLTSISTVWILDHPMHLPQHATSMVRHPKRFVVSRWSS